MITNCNICNSENNSKDLFCFHCKSPLWNSETMIQKLIEKQNLLEEKYVSDINLLKIEIKQLATFLEEKPKFSPTATSTAEATINTSQKRNNVVTTPKPEIKKPVSIAKKQPINKRKIPSEPSKFQLQIQSFVAPLHQGISLFTITYNRYKDEGKLPIFFMTIAGLIAILFGTGYLMQSSFQYMGIYADVVKITGGFIVSFIAGFIGLRLYNRDKKLEEYASALLSLFIVLNYLLIYFLSDLGNFPILSSALLGFVLIVVNTALAIYIALRFETKVVSVLSLLGGALAPFYLNATNDGSFYYIYLWLLSAASCFVAYKIKWKTLQYLTFLLVISLLETTIFNYRPNQLLFTIYYHLFAYLFFYVVLFKKNKIKDQLIKVDLIILATNLSLFLLNHYILFNNNLPTLGLIFLANTLLFIAPLVKFWNQLSKKIRLILLLVIGSLVGLAIPSLFGQALMGLFWSIEAIVLIILGFSFSIPSIRKEGYLVLLVAGYKLIESSQLIFLKWNTTILHEGFLNYIVLGIVVSSLWFISRKFKNEFTDFESKLFSIVQEITPVWLASIFMLISYHTLGNWGLNTAIIPMLGLILWDKIFNTKTSASIGIAHLAFYLIAFGLSVDTTNSFRFSQQELFAQISLIQLFLSLWATQFYFEKIGFKNQFSYVISHALRILFFCLIPILFIHQVNKHFDNYLAIGIWVAVLITYLLQRVVKYNILIYEAFLLFVIALIIPFTLEQFNTASTLVILAILFTISMMEKSYVLRHLVTSAYRPILIFTPFLICATIAFGFTGLIDHIEASVSLFGSLLLINVFFKSKVAVCDYIKKWVIKTATLSTFIGILIYAVLTVESSRPDSLIFILSTINTIALGILLRNKNGWYNLPTENTRWSTALLLSQLLIIANYSMLLDIVGIGLDGPLFSILLVIQAIVLLFMALKYQIKLLNKASIILFISALAKVVTHDISDFSTNQKIVVLIILGILLLGASYLYVKLKDRFDKMKNIPS